MANDAVQIRLSLENEKLTKQLRDTERKFSKLESAAKKSADGISSAFVGAAKGIAAAFVSVEAARSFATAVVNTSKAVADLNDKAQQVGISFKAFQELQYTAIQTGTDIEKMTASIGKMQVALGNMAESGADESLEKLGLDIENIINLSPDEQFKAIIEALSKIENPAQRAAAATDFFGKGFKELNPLINQGAGGLDGYAAAANQLGIVISDVTRDEMAKFDDALETMRLQLQASLAEGFGPLVAYINSEYAAAAKNGTNNTNILTEALTRVSALAIGTSETFKNWDWGNPQTWGALTKITENSLAALEEIKRKREVIAKINWDNFEPKAAPAFIGSAVSSATGSAEKAAAKAADDAKKRGEEEAKRYIEGFNKTLASSQFDTFASQVELGGIGASENVTAQTKLAIDLTKELINIQSSGYQAEHQKALEDEAVARYNINTAILEGNAALQQQKIDNEAALDSAEKAADKRKAIADNVTSSITNALDAIILGAATAEEAVMDLIRQLLIALAQAALLKAFGAGGSYGSILGGIIGGQSATPQASPMIRIYNQGGGLVTSRRRSNGDTDLIIGQLATAISKGGNQLDKALRRTYGIGRQGV